MKKRKTVKDVCNEKPVDLETYYNSNPSAVRFKEAFDLRCKKCNGKYILIGITWFVKQDNGIEVKGKRYQIVAPNMLCLECNNQAQAVTLANTDGGVILVNKK